MDRCIAGFLVSRNLAGEREDSLNVAVAPRFCRRGIALALIAYELSIPASAWFLEVRQNPILMPKSSMKEQDFARPAAVRATMLTPRRELLS